MGSSEKPAPQGCVLDEVSFRVEAGKVREFSRATYTADPVHTDIEAARAAGFSTIPATPTHVVAGGHYRDQQGFVKTLGMTIERVVVGSVDWEYVRPLVVGDNLTGTRRIVDDTTKEGKRGGTMRLVTLETTWVDEHGHTAVLQRETLIERSAS